MVQVQVQNTTLVEGFGELAARRISRRSTLQVLAKATFATAATWAAGGVFGVNRAYAGTCQATVGSEQYCQPPGGQYCYSSQCSGENCVGSIGCVIDKNIEWHSTGCWCTGSFPNYNCSSKGYYKCCDCICNGTKSCGCASYHSVCSGGPSSCC